MRIANALFASSMFRAGRVPDLIRTDQGPEFKNAIMQEYCACVGIGRRFGTPWRPVEQGLVEGLHKETQKVMGMLVHDVLKCLPNEVGELFNLIEFIIYNTPGSHGYTPRDIDRRWSMSTALERELQPFQVQEFEPLEDYVRELFQNYGLIKTKVLTHLQSKSLERAELANRFRQSKTFQAGDRAVSYTHLTLPTKA